MVDQGSTFRILLDRHLVRQTLKSNLILVVDGGHYRQLFKRQLLFFFFAFIVFSFSTSQFWNPLEVQIRWFGEPDWACEPLVDDHCRE